MYLEGVIFVLFIYIFIYLPVYVQREETLTLKIHHKFIAGKKYVRGNNSFWMYTWMVT